MGTVCDRKRLTVHDLEPPDRHRLSHGRPGRHRWDLDMTGGRVRLARLARMARLAGGAERSDHCALQVRLGPQGAAVRGHDHGPHLPDERRRRYLPQRLRRWGKQPPTAFDGYLPQRLRRCGVQPTGGVEGLPVELQAVKVPGLIRCHRVLSVHVIEPVGPCLRRPGWTLTPSPPPGGNARPRRTSPPCREFRSSRHRSGAAGHDPRDRMRSPSPSGRMPSTGCRPGRR